MTLATELRVYDPLDVRDVFAHARRLLGADESIPIERSEGVHDGDERWSHPLGVGLSAWLVMEFGADGPVDYSNWVDDDPVNAEPFAIRVVFDTGYSYEADNGASCSDLHAWLVREMGRWFDERGVRWAWNHEYEGTWFNSVSDVPELGDAERGALTTVAQS